MGYNLGVEKEIFEARNRKQRREGGIIKRVKGRKERGIGKTE